MSYSLEDLKAEAEESKNRNLEMLRKRYQLARSLGFTSEEARILSHKTEDDINRLAIERDGKEKSP